MNNKMFVSQYEPFEYEFLNDLLSGFMATYFAWTMTMLELPEFGPICHDQCTSDPEVFDREMLRA